MELDLINLKTNQFHESRHNIQKEKTVL